MLKAILTLLCLGSPALVEGQSLSAEAKAAWSAISGNIRKAAEKIPASEYTFRPTPEVRSTGALFGHVVDAHYLFCSPLHSNPKPGPGAEKKFSTKTELVAAINESVAYCDAVYEQATDEKAGAPAKLFGRDRASLSILHMNIAHDNEHYGNIVTYMRVRGMIPPSSEGRANAQLPRLYYDQAHGETDPHAQMFGIAGKLKIETSRSEMPISTASLTGSRLLYLRAPSKAFAASEKEAIVAFVRQGGSLLLVLDEEIRQSLAATGVNDLIAPFGMKLTGDTEYLHNCGAVAKAGEINTADREIPYSGGRAVEGGTPFAYQLDRNGKPGLPFAAWKKLEGGGRVVVMGEGMASLFLGVPQGERLTGKPRDPAGTVFWGKESTPFMEEVIGWLVQR